MPCPRRRLGGGSAPESLVVEPCCFPSPRRRARLALVASVEALASSSNEKSIHECSMWLERRARRVQPPRGKQRRGARQPPRAVAIAMLRLSSGCPRRRVTVTPISVDRACDRAMRAYLFPSPSLRQRARAVDITQTHAAPNLQSAAFICIGHPRSTPRL